MIFWLVLKLGISDQPKKFGHHEIGIQNPFSTTNREEGSSNVTKDFLAFVLTNVMNVIDTLRRVLM
jgi:hypothetical protein